MVTVKCCVPECKDKLSVRHRFPNPKKDSARMKAWINIINNAELFVLSFDEMYRVKVVCHQHFNNSSYTQGCKRLHRNAMPTKNFMKASEYRIKKLTELLPSTEKKSKASLDMTDEFNVGVTFRM
ncbi:hypothetical protein RI129_002955 [Pyrocoelia pectoralis]|uniref:THAP-type domain-containing protein n=1 Tax=Pyrocoelia pectoralis TaxID=417401 RepID=A0AAN7VP49_9COLE